MLKTNNTVVSRNYWLKYIYKYIPYIMRYNERLINLKVALKVQNLKREVTKTSSF